MRKRLRTTRCKCGPACILIDPPQAPDWRVRADLTDAFEASTLPFKVDSVEASHLAPGMAERVPLLGC